jgi:hypothetical protein
MPITEKLVLPQGYGQTTEPMAWEQVRAQLAQAKQYWLATNQLRHSALTHLAEQIVSLPLLMAKSRHARLRSLQRYARPGAEAVAAITAATDPARRRDLGLPE